MNEIEVKLTFSDYDLKRAKPFTRSSIVYIRKDWVGKVVNIIPVKDYVDVNVIEDCIHEDGYYKVILYTNIILKKVVRGNDRIGRIYLPYDMLGLNLLIFEAPEIEF